MIKNNQIVYYVIEKHNFLGIKNINSTVFNFEDVSSIFLNILKYEDHIEIPTCLLNYYTQIKNSISEDTPIPLDLGNLNRLFGSPSTVIKKIMSSFNFKQLQEYVYNEEKYYLFNNIILNDMFIPLVIVTLDIAPVEYSVISDINLIVSPKVFTDKENKLYDLILKCIFKESLNNFEYFQLYSQITNPFRAFLGLNSNYNFNVKVMDTSKFINVPQVSDHEDFQETLIKVKDTMNLDD